MTLFHCANNGFGLMSAELISKEHVAVQFWVWTALWWAVVLTVIALGG